MFVDHGLEGITLAVVKAVEKGLFLVRLSAVVAGLLAVLIGKNVVIFQLGVSIRFIGLGVAIVDLRFQVFPASVSKSEMMLSASSLIFVINSDQAEYTALLVGIGGTGRKGFFHAQPFP